MKYSIFWYEITFIKLYFSFTERSIQKTHQPLDPEGLVLDSCLLLLELLALCFRVCPGLIIRKPVLILGVSLSFCKETETGSGSS